MLPADGPRSDVPIGEVHCLLDIILDIKLLSTRSGCRRCDQGPRRMD
jgi:hypothetical protein